MRTALLIFCCLAFFNVRSQQLSDSSKSSPDAADERNQIYTLADKMATFPGGYNGWVRYLQKNIDYSIPKKNNAPPGKYNVIVMFIIDQKGNVSEIKSLTQHGYGMENEAVRLIENGPRWSPAIQKGKPVMSYRKQPLTFTVTPN